MEAVGQAAKWLKTESTLTEDNPLSQDIDIPTITN